MYPLNQTELELVLGTVGGKSSLNYTIYESRTNTIVTNTLKDNGNGSNKNNHKLLLVRAADSITKAWFANYTFARFWFGTLINFLITLSGVGIIIHGMSQKDRLFIIIGIVSLFASAIMGYTASSTQSPSEIDFNVVSSELRGHKTAKNVRKRAHYLLKEHLALSEESSSNISYKEWIIERTRDNHHIYRRRSVQNSQPQQILMLLDSTRRIHRKLATREDKNIVYGLRFTYYYPNHGPALQAEYESVTNDANSTADFVLETIGHQSNKSCVYLGLPESVFKMAGKMELLTYNHMDTGP